MNKVLISYILFIFIGCCNSGTDKGVIRNKYFWEAHTETWSTKFGRFARDYDASYVIIIIRKDNTQMVTVPKALYDLVLEGDSMHFTHTGIIHNGAELINSPYVKLYPDIAGRPHYYRQYWPRSSVPSYTKPRRLSRS